MKTLNCQPTSHWNPVPRPEQEEPCEPCEREASPQPDPQSVRDYLDCPLTRTLEQKYGARWEQMHKYSKLTFRAILSLYVFWSYWLAAASPQDLMAEAIEQTNSDLHLDDPDVYEAIANCTELPILDLERLLEALGEQIREECWNPSGPTVPNSHGAS